MDPFFGVRNPRNGRNAEIRKDNVAFNRKRNAACVLAPPAGATVEALEGRQLLSASGSSATPILVSTGANGKGAGNNLSGSDINAGPLPASVSANGQAIAYISDATNLVTGASGTSTNSQVYAYNSQTKTNSLISSNPAGNQLGNGQSGVSPAILGPGGGTEGEGPVVSPNGQFIAFVSSATNLVAGESNTTKAPELYLRNLATNTTTLVTAASKGTASIDSQVGAAVFSGNSQYLAFVSDGKDLVPGLTKASGAECLRGQSLDRRHHPGKHAGHRAYQRVIRHDDHRRAGQRGRHGSVDQRRRPVRDLCQPGQQPRAEHSGVDSERLSPGPSQQHDHAGVGQ